jgi:glycosyltransferase involved in cell wall biosynthesis
MPRILHIINKLDIGGAEVMILDILKYANRDEFDYHILLPYGKGELDNRAESYDINLHYLDGDKSSGKMKLLRQGVDKIRELKPDLIHTHTRFSDLIGLYGGKRAGVKTRIITIHAAGFYFLDSMPLHEGLIEYFVVRYASHFVVISKGVGEYIQKFGNVNPNFITLIYNGIDPERVCPEIINNRDAVRRNLGISEDEFVIVSMGRLIHEKGFDILLDEFKTYRNKTGNGKLIIIGYGKESGKLKEKASELNVAEHVIFTGKIDNPSELMRASDCFVLASRKEGFGITILEAMANGIPVIASDTGGIPEIINDGENGILVDVKKKSSISKAIESIQSDKEMVEKFIGAGKTTALEKFHVKHTSARYEDLYRELLSVKAGK